MKPQDVCTRLEYNRLELIPSDFDPVAPAGSRLTQVWQQARTGLNRVGEATLAFLSGSHDPQIVQRRDRTGQAYFQVYDPVTQLHHRFAAEVDLRQWLDQRYYQ